jgi:hypothetical protein
MPPRLLFSTLPCSLCKRNDDWLLETRFIKDRFAEIVLKRRSRPFSVLLRGAQFLFLTILCQQVYNFLGQYAAASIMVLLCFLWIVSIRTVVTEERVQAVRGLGLTVSTHFASGRITSRFIDYNSIQSIIVNEGFQNCGIHFYLACVVEDCNRLQLLFQEAKPRLPVIARIYKDITTILH